MDKKPTCNICEKKFSLHKHLVRHEERTHGKRNQVICEFCDVKFQSSGALRTHVANVHTFGQVEV